MNDRLFSLIKAARLRWRLRLALHGAAVVALTILAAVVVATWLMDATRFGAVAVRVLPALVWGTLIGVAWWAVRRATRRADDAQVALYLEEREPSFNGSLLAAVHHARGADAALTSPALVDRVIASAVSTGEGAAVWRTLERPAINRAGMVLGATALAGLALLLTRPAFLASGAPFLVPLHAAARPYTISAEPGDTTIPRGADLEVSAVLNGFDAEGATLLLRREGRDDWESVPMVSADSVRRFQALVLDVRQPLRFVIEAAGVRSDEHLVRVADLPWVDSIATTLSFPDYTGLAPRDVPGGDVAALAGTRVQVRILPTMPAPRGALAIGADTVALEAGADGRLTGTFTVRQNGEYRVLLEGPGGRLAPASNAYLVEVLEDQPPSVRMTRPGRDADATAVDEIFLEAQAEDDVGIGRLELRYSVNGGPERTVPLHRGPARREVVAGHTLFLEELPLQPGDVISYHARAVDTRPGAPEQLSDIYFLTIRPFDRAFREAEQNGMPGEASASVGDLSERQRQIVAGIFRLIQSRATMPPAEQRDHLSTLALGEGRLREDVTTLLRRLRTRGVAGADTAMATVADALDSALVAMTEAEGALGRRQTDPALNPAQRALAHLQRAEAVFDREREVSRGNPQGGGAAARAEELADLFELELDRMRNQYETIQRDRQRQAEAERDELQERLRELARRQQRENERRAAQQRSAQGGGGAASQRELAAEADSLARRLERLSREQESPEMAEAAQRVRDAVNQMRQAGTGNNSAGAEAADRLREAQRQLTRGETGQQRREAQEAAARARHLAETQEQVAEDVSRLQRADPAQRGEQARGLVERKDRMAAEVRALEGDLERMARDAQGAQPEAARQMREAARAARDGRLEDKIRYSRGVMQGRDSAYARAFEEQIAGDLDSLAARLARAAEAVGESREDRVAQALENTRDATAGLESLAERMRAAQPRGQQGQQGQESAGRQQAQQGGTPSGGSADARRQAQRELRERAGLRREARDLLRREGVETRELDGMLNELSRADNDGPAGTPLGLEQLLNRVVPGLRDAEFALRRQLLGASSAPHAGAEAAVPPAYRAQVEEYYRALAERRPR